MKLGEIRRYVKQRGESTLADVAIHFDISKEAAKLGLEYWVNKGIVQAQAASCGSACGGCGSSTENYAWINQETKIHWFR